jgi:hypothetical protein
MNHVLAKNGNAATATQVKVLKWVAVFFCISYVLWAIYLLIIICLEEIPKEDWNYFTITAVWNSLVIVWDIPVILSMLYLNYQRMTQIKMQ